MRRFAVWIALVLLALVHTPPAAAQRAPASALLDGAVLDTTRAPIAGAHVTAIADGQAAGPSTMTDQNGLFALSLAPGRYTLRVAADGFVEASQRVTASPAGRASREIVLTVAGVREAVTVSAPAPAGGYQVPATRTATKTSTPLLDVPQSVTIVTKTLMDDQLMMSLGDVMRYVPGAAVHQGENNRDEVILRGNDSSANFFVDGVRDDVQYYRDLYNLSRVEVLKGPNALIFGRGGAGGVVNRVEKEALFQPVRQVTLQGGMFGNKRFTTDLDQPLSDTVAVRLNGMFEDSDSFRTDVGLKRYGVTPTFTFTPSARTKIVASYEYLNDTRVADRGITSFHGRPADVDPSTYYGNPADSHVDASVNVGYVTIEHHAGAVTVRNHTSIANYDRSYQNFVPGAVSADQSRVTLTAYNNATDRTNLFNQTDVTYAAATGAVQHTLLAGVEVGRQLTDNFRNTGYFNDATSSISIPFSSTMVTTPVTFRQSATDANNHVRTNLAAGYVQDQVALSPHLQVVGGLRFDRFDLQYHNNRTGMDLERPDNLLSPRAGVIVKPTADLSLYGSYSVSYLPSSGDQFSSLTAVTQQLQPEKFSNYEVGAKWLARPGFEVTTALYRLDRTNTRSTDPNDPTRIVQTGSQRTNGYELGVNGQITPTWSVAGGYALQDAFVTSATTAAAAGAQVGQVPHHTLSLWNRYRFHPRVSAGVGVLYRSDMFVAVDNTVTLPGYVRADGAVYFTLSKQVRLQANVENLFDTAYYLNADSNTNISPGFPRTLRVGLTTTF
jgi:catecholate siderophore receptor